MGASRAMRRRRVAGANSRAAAPRRTMSTSFLARVRWANVAVALLVAGLLGLVVAWPLLTPDAPVLPPEVGSVQAPAVPLAEAGEHGDRTAPARSRKGAGRRAAEPSRRSRHAAPAGSRR